MYADDMMRRLFAALIALLALASPAGAVTTLTLTEPVAQANQVISGSWGTRTSPVIHAGSYTGTAPAGIECQLYLSTDGTTVEQAWTALTSATINAGTYTGTLSSPWAELLYVSQCRASDTPAVVSAKTTRGFGAGITFMCSGQSQCDRLWVSTSECPTATFTLGSGTIHGFNACAMNNLFGPAWLIGKQAYSSNFTGGVATITGYTAPDTMTVAAASVIATGTFDVQVEVQTPTPSPVAFRLNAGSSGINPVGDAAHGSENNVAHASGEIFLANYLEAACQCAVMLIETAQGGSLSSSWTQTPPGARYTYTQNLISGGGSNSLQKVGFINHEQGGADTLNQNFVAPSVYAAHVADTLAWMLALSPSTVVRAVTPLGVVVPVSPPVSTDAEVSGIRDVNYGSIDAITVVNAGLDWACEHVGGNAVGGPVHLTPLGQQCWARAMVQSVLRQAAVMTFGYGPKPATQTWNNDVLIDVTFTQDGGTGLTCTGNTTTCPAIKAFEVCPGACTGSNAITISSTALVQPNTVRLTLASVPSSTPFVRYGYGMNAGGVGAAIATSLVFDDKRADCNGGCTIAAEGMQAQHSVGYITPSPPPPATGGGRLRL